VPRDRATNRKVARALYRHAHRAVKSSGLPVIEVNDAQQRGNSFGARLANAFVDAFAAGYEHIIAVGSDCPRLHEVDWQSIAAHLKDGSPVLGPTSDSHGAYLIGLSRAQFNHGAFAALPWRSPGLLDALVDHLWRSSGQSPVRLAACSDVNNPQDLWAFVRAASGHFTPLVEQLLVALGRATPDARPIDRLASAGWAYIPSSRAPPVGRAVLP
jgi:glycosyltransferase A (GT-A) superfamily protein (DUF2064 family)